MPYNKNYKRNYKKKPYVRGNKTKKMVTGQGPTLLEKIAAQSDNVGRVARSILPIAMAINTELKYFDNAGTGAVYNPGTNDSIINLTQGIATGNTDITRIGNSILAKNIAIKLYTEFLVDNLTPIHRATSRVILMVWKENLQQNPPTAAKIFEVPANMYSPFNKDYTDQMVILKDKVVTHEAQLQTSSIQAPKFMKIYKNLDFHMRWDASTANSGTVNHVYLIIRGSGASVSSQIPYSVYARLNYTDN